MPQGYSSDGGEGFKMAQFMLSLALSDGPSRRRTPSSRYGKEGSVRSFRSSASPLLPKIGHTRSTKPSGRELSGDFREPSSGFGEVDVVSTPTENQLQKFDPDSTSGGDAADPGSSNSGSGFGLKSRDADGALDRVSVTFSDEPDNLASIAAEIERRAKQLELLAFKRNELRFTIEQERHTAESTSEHLSHYIYINNICII